MRRRESSGAVKYGLRRAGMWLALAASLGLVGACGWEDVDDIPPGFADGVDNDTPTVAGEGLTQAGNELSVEFEGTGSGLGTADMVARSDHDHDLAYWMLGGNTGTMPGTDFIGTTDAQAFEIKVNALRALRVEPDPTASESPNIIGGHSGNSVRAPARGATISGGGDVAFQNRVADDYGVIGGGRGNQAGDDAGDIFDAAYATVGGGWENTAGGAMATVGGGWNNTADGDRATIAGGQDNIVDASFATVGGGNGNTASSNRATVGGGWNNTASGALATVSGGSNNTAGAGTATVGGGQDNVAGGGATVGGGWSNTASGVSTTIAGGQGNVADASVATVGGGSNNTASGVSATVGGGSVNAASGLSATVGGGNSNAASGGYSTVGGGWYNLATAAYSTISGGGPSIAGQPDTTNNVVYDTYGTIGGGGNNRAGSDDGFSSSHIYATVGGGEGNAASGDRATVGGGWNNSAGAAATTVAGGRDNAASGTYDTLGGGYDNQASGGGATVGGGISNEASGTWSTVGGGLTNTAGGQYSVVPGGLLNTTAGNYSLAAGMQAKANHHGAFVWADSTGADFLSTADNQFLIRAAGGVGINTAIPGSALHVAGPITTATNSVAGNYTLTDTDSVLFVDSSAASRTIMLPPASAATVGRVYHIYKADAGGATTITVMADGADTLNGQATIFQPYGCMRVIGFTATEWIANVTE